MKTALCYAIRAFGHLGKPITKFWESLPDLAAARLTAKEAHEDSWRYIEIVAYRPGKGRIVIETIGGLS